VTSKRPSFLPINQTMDANGNTVLSGGVSDSYDFENHLTQHGAVTIVYDGDGNRVAETVGGVTTNYLVDMQNPTGYAQVVDELQSGTVTRRYSYGLERISETQSSTTSFYGYDGHGSVRFLTSSAGAITDSYDYDAFGNLTNSTGSTPNNYLFAGEQYDPALSLYYNRARYLNTATDRFWSMDSYEGDSESPASLHKYLYAQSDAVDFTDPSGHEIDEVLGAVGIYATLGALSGLAVIGTFKGFLLGAAGGGALGVACSTGELCVRSGVSGVLNVVFQTAANLYESYYDRTLGLPPPNSVKQRESLVAAFAAGAATPFIAQFVADPNDLARIAALQSAFNSTYKAFLQGKTFQQALVQGVESALIAYVVQVGIDKDFGPQFYSPQVVDFILRLDPPLHRFIYGN
jgi:RHS repeat-associated protein